MAWPLRWWQLWFHSPPLAELVLFWLCDHCQNGHSSPVHSMCPCWGSSVFGGQIRQPEGFSLCAVMGPAHLLQCIPPVCFAWHLCCQDSPLSSLFHGRSSQVTFPAQEQYLLGQMQAAGRRHRTFAPQSPLCLERADGGARVGCWMVIREGGSCDWVRGNGSVKCWMQSCPQVRLTVGWRHGTAAGGLTVDWPDEVCQTPLLADAPEGCFGPDEVETHLCCLHRQKKQCPQICSHTKRMFITCFNLEHAAFIKTLVCIS